MCTTIRTKKLIVGLALVAVTVGCSYAHVPISIRFTFAVAFFMVLPVTVLIINVILIREMRRASNNNANLGLQQHQQSQSAVPTVMLVTTSLVYILLSGCWIITEVLMKILPSYTLFVHRVIWIARTMSYFIYAYNFYVYLITGRQFRADLRTLFCCRSSFSSVAPAVAPAVAAAARNRNDIRLTERRQADTAV